MQFQNKLPTISAFAVSSSELSQTIPAIFDTRTRFYRKTIITDDTEMIEKAASEAILVIDRLKQLRKRKGQTGMEMLRKVDQFLDEQAKLKNGMDQIAADVRQNLILNVDSLLKAETDPPSVN